MVFPPPSKYQAVTGKGFTPALQRARRPYLVRNVLTGVALLSFTAAVYSYAILAVKQDDLGDIPLPSPPPPSPSSSVNNNDNKTI